MSTRRRETEIRDAKHTLYAKIFMNNYIKWVKNGWKTKLSEDSWLNSS